MVTVVKWLNLMITVKTKINKTYYILRIMQKNKFSSN